MTAAVHPSAVVHPGAVLGDEVIVGPLSVVGEGVELGEGTELVAQATVLGPCRIGRRNRLFPHATLGAPPQDRSFSGEATELLVGDDNEFREGVTVHRGTMKGGGATRIGSGGLFMVGAHVAHDAQVGNLVTLANFTSLGGHVVVGDRFVAGGHVAVAPYVTLGEVSFAAGGAMIERDVPPFVIVAGDRAKVRGLNRVGLERAGIAPESRAALEAAYSALWRSREPLATAARSLSPELARDPYVARLLASLGSLTSTR